jgi:hypothetical protein
MAAIAGSHVVRSADIEMLSRFREEINAAERHGPGQIAIA